MPLRQREGRHTYRQRKAVGEQTSSVRILEARQNIFKKTGKKIYTQLKHTVFKVCTQIRTALRQFYGII